MTVKAKFSGVVRVSPFQDTNPNSNLNINLDTNFDSNPDSNPDTNPKPRGKNRLVVIYFAGIRGIASCKGSRGVAVGGWGLTNATLYICVYICIYVCIYIYIYMIDFSIDNKVLNTTEVERC